MLMPSAGVDPSLVLPSRGDDGDGTDDDSTALVLKMPQHNVTSLFLGAVIAVAAASAGAGGEFGRSRICSAG